MIGFEALGLFFSGVSFGSHDLSLIQRFGSQSTFAWF
jgi:hypothetical protein